MDIQKYQQDLNKIECNNERISILQRKSRARLQIVQHNSNHFIKSINDKYKNIRILIFGTMINIFRYQNRQMFNLLKRMVYQSSLQHITISRGLVKQQIHKIIGFKLNQLYQSYQIQDNVLKCFNCIAFFDQAIISSFIQYLNLEYCQPLEIWKYAISTLFHLEFINMGESTIQDEQYNIYLRKQKDQLYFVLSKIQQNSQMQKSMNSQILSENNEVNVNHTIISIDSCDSPLLQNKQNKPLNKSIKKRLSSKLQISRNRQSKSTFWAIFCCNE